MPSCHCSEIAAYKQDKTQLETALDDLSNCRKAVPDVETDLKQLKIKVAKGFKVSMDSVKPNKLTKPFYEELDTAKGYIQGRLSAVKSQLKDWIRDDDAYHASQNKKNQ
jgi:hypothetical protein